MTSTKPKFIVYGNGIRNNSFGVRVLHRLSALLNIAGYESICSRKTPMTDRNNTIVIYPETVRGNPLNSKYVVRYLLNLPGKIYHHNPIQKGDYLIAYSEFIGNQVRSNCLLNLTQTLFEDYFCYNGEIKDIDYSFYVGKGCNTGYIFDGTVVEITKQYPDTRTELSSILKRSKNFYTYDDFTALTEEAKRCGCVVKIIKRNKLIDPVYSKIFTLEEENEQMMYFISDCIKYFSINKG